MANTSAATENEKDCPKALKCDGTVVDIRFHPDQDVIAAGSIEGPVKLYSYSTKEANHELMTFSHHKKASRAVRFSKSGQKLYTISKDKSLAVVDLEKGSLLQHIKQAHISAIYSLLPVDDNIIATGDDDGTLKIWDMRQEKAVMEIKENEEFISDMVIEPSHRILVASSGEGCITAFDIRKHKKTVQSELFDSELLSLALVKSGRKLVCGSGDGTLNIFNWGEFGNISDRFPGHPESVDCICPITDDVICTGSIDGNIRAVHIHPNRFIGIVGKHDEFPIENLSISRCSTYLASCSHDNVVKFWNIRDLPDEKVSEKKKAMKTNNPKVLTSAGGGADFFSDLQDGNDDNESEDSDDDSDSDSDAEPAKKKQKLDSNSGKEYPTQNEVKDSESDSDFNDSNVNNDKDDEADEDEDEVGSDVNSDDSDNDSDSDIEESTL